MPPGRYGRGVSVPPSISAQVALRRADEIIARPVDDGALLVHLSSGQVWHLNRTGAQMWELVDGQRTLALISAEIASAWGIAGEAALRDVLQVADALIGEGLLRAAEPAP
jgi:hypothetical protein